MEKEQILQIEIIYFKSVSVPDLSAEVYAFTYLVGVLVCNNL